MPKDQAIPLIENNAFVTFDKKPVSFIDYHVRLEKPHPYERQLAIILQGPIVQQQEFTLESVKLYRHTLPESPIIISTWDTEPEEALAALREAGATVIVNKAPDIPCFCFMNHQIVSTQAGIAKAEELGAKYVLKSRTDQRYYETGIGRFLFNLLKTFPLPEEHAKGQKGRLVSLGFNTFKYRLYDISDMFIFGHIEDVKMYWDCPLETRSEFPKFQTLREYCRLRPCEIYFATDYLERIGHKLQYTLADSWRVYSDYFCIIDEHALGFYWPKHSNATFRWRNFFGEHQELEELTFKEWLALHLGKKPEPWQEQSLDEGAPLSFLQRTHSKFTGFIRSQKLRLSSFIRA